MSQRSLFLELAVGAFTLSLVACGADTGDGGGPDAAGADLTYWKDIKPIVDAKCVTCHYEGGVAPMSLDSYEDVKTNAGVAKLNIHEGLMPPWPPVDGCDEYVADRSLTDRQETMILDWIEAGAAEGDPGREGDPLQVEDVSLSRVDLEMTMENEYTPSKSPDDYRCFVIPWPEDETTYVTGFNTLPGNEGIVHHVIAFLAEPGSVDTYHQLDADEEGPGYTCFGGTGGPAQEWIGGWAPGGQGQDFPEGTGIPIEPGSAIILQVHYNVLQADPASDQTTIQVKLDDQVEKEAWVQPWTNPQWTSSDSMHIPAGESDVMHSFAFDAATAINGGEPFLIHSSNLHMHQLGTRGTLRIDRSDGDSDCLLEIDDWDFDWQDSYGHREPKRFDPGDELYIECHWDNTPENQPIVDGQPITPRDVYWGEGTTDEMCLGAFFLSEI